MPDLVRTISWRGSASQEMEPLLTREWLVTNGLGGYASGTLAGVLTRRYHGHLIAALPAPLGRKNMLSDVPVQMRLADGTTVPLSGEETAERLTMHGSEHLEEFRLDRYMPTWRFGLAGLSLEKRLLLLHGQNTVHITFRLLQAADAVRLEMRPVMHFRGHDEPVSTSVEGPYGIHVTGEQYEFSAPGLPPLRMLLHGENAAFTIDRKQIRQVLYRQEESRGYDWQGDLWSPGFFQAELGEGGEATLVASTESWETLRALSTEEAEAAERGRLRFLIAAAHPDAREGFGAELVAAADQFVITPAGRVEDAARARASGDEVRTVIAGYHWFTDWGRDTMISLEGLTLTTGRRAEAGWILRTFAHYIRDGLIPNMFPEGKTEGLYHTADATLWFFHSLNRYVEATGDRLTLRGVLPKLLSIVDHHVNGAPFGIRVDPGDGLLIQGAPGFQLTWMDAKVDGWVVTPRRGKAVEINALWYNALRLLGKWLEEERGEASAQAVSERAACARESFNRRFWYEAGGYLYDVVDGERGDDASCRPNQLLAISLDYPVLERSRWEPVLKVAEERLLTPVGLRSLAPGEPDYKSKYYGDLRSRDAAYHQGTVWAWLIGPFIDAWLKVHPGEKAAARKFLEGFQAEMNDSGVGSISEIFDAEAPFAPRGCIAQAWSVAEVLRSWVKTAGYGAYDFMTIRVQ